MRSNSAKQGDQASWGLKLAAWGGLVFLHFPIVIICLYAFNTEDAAFSFPPQGFTLDWFSVAFAREDVLESIKLSLQIACVATLIAMVLGTLAAAALYRRDFFGKETGDLGEGTVDGSDDALSRGHHDRLDGLFENDDADGW